MTASIADGVVSGLAVLSVFALLLLVSLGLLFPALVRGMHIWLLLCIAIGVPLALFIGMTSGYFAYKNFSSPNRPTWIPIVVVTILIAFTIFILFTYGYIFTADDMGLAVFYFTYLLIIICSPIILIANLINILIVRKQARATQGASPLPLSSDLSVTASTTYELQPPLANKSHIRHFSWAIGMICVFCGILTTWIIGVFPFGYFILLILSLATVGIAAFLITRQRNNPKDLYLCTYTISTAMSSGIFCIILVN